MIKSQQKEALIVNQTRRKGSEARHSIGPRNAERLDTRDCGTPAKHDKRECQFRTVEPNIRKLSTPA